MITTPMPSSRRARAARLEARRQQKLTAFFVVVGTLAIIAAFAGGFAWWSGSWFAGTDSKITAEALDPVEREEAARLIDEAVTARFEQNPVAAIAVVRRALDIHPEVRGADILVGEIALESGEMDVLAEAARRALARGDNPSDAKLLLALHAWLLRGQAGATDSGLAATQLLLEASDEKLSNGATRFFAGDLSRVAGLPRDAHVNLLASLHRQHAWHSVDLLTFKMRLAQQETGRNLHGTLSDGSSIADRAFSSLAPGIEQKQLGAFGGGNMFVFFTPSQAAILTNDQRLRGRLLDRDFFLQLNAQLSELIGASSSLPRAD